MQACRQPSGLSISGSHGAPAKGSPWESVFRACRTYFFDEFDLAFDVRGASAQTGSGSCCKCVAIGAADFIRLSKG